MKLRRLFLLLLLFPPFAMNIFAQNGEYFLHTVEQGQTVYGISHLYNVPLEAVYNLNPAAMQGIKMGEQLKIPQTSGKGEVFFASTDKQPKKLSTVRVALLLPFPTGSRMVEYYEGFLLALKEIKKEGISVNLQVYNIGIGMDSVYPILENPKLAKANVIIGGLSDAQIKAIAAYSHEQNIPYVIPLTSQSDEPAKYSTVFQINPPQAQVYAKASAAFVKKYKNEPIIFYSPNGTGNKSDFIQLLKKDLTTAKISYQTIQTNNLTSADILPLLADYQNNVLIPSDDSEAVLLQAIQALKEVAESKTNAAVSLFGHPSWQIYSNKYLDNFSSLNTTFYSLFYANPTSPQVKTFRNNYAHWYSKDLINTFPKYGMLGYDTGLYFIQLLHQYGTAYDNYVNKVKTDGVQTDFHFEQVNPNGGFINTHLYFVQFHPDATITTQSIK